MIKFEIVSNFLFVSFGWIELTNDYDFLKLPFDRFISMEKKAS